MRILLICFVGVVLFGSNNLVKSQGLNYAPTRVVTAVAPLPSEAYSEGECASAQAMAIDVNWMVQQKQFYVPIASQFAYRRYAETLLSRAPNSEDELQSMCLTVEAAQSGMALNLTNFGYDDREFRQTCMPGSEQKINCLAAGSSAGVNPTKTRATENAIVFWDRRSYMIIVRCVEGYFRDFQLLSTRPTVSHEVYNSVLNVTRNLGFDERRIQTMSYDNCLRTNHGVTASHANNIEGRSNHNRGSPIRNGVLAAPYAKNININAENINIRIPQNQVPQNYQNNQQLQIDPGQLQGPGGYPPPFLDPNGYPQFL